MKPHREIPVRSFAAEFDLGPHIGAGLVEVTVTEAVPVALVAQVLRQIAAELELEEQS